MNNIVRHARDCETHPSHARRHPMMKNAIKTPIDRPISKTTRESYALAKRGIALIHGEIAQSETDSDPGTIS
jgi:hypothetical protein